MNRLQDRYSRNRNRDNNNLGDENNEPHTTINIDRPVENNTTNVEARDRCENSSRQRRRTNTRGLTVEDVERIVLADELHISRAQRHPIFISWLSALAYTFSLTIITALYFFPTDVELNSSDFDIESEPFSEPVTEERIGYIVEDSNREQAYKQRVQNLYLVILSALVGYFEAVREYRR